VGVLWHFGGENLKKDEKKLKNAGKPKNRAA